MPGGDQTSSTCSLFDPGQLLTFSASVSSPVKCAYLRGYKEVNYTGSQGQFLAQTSPCRSTSCYHLGVTGVGDSMRKVLRVPSGIRHVLGAV